MEFTPLKEFPKYEINNSGIIRGIKNKRIVAIKDGKARLYNAEGKQVSVLVESLKPAKKETPKKADAKKKKGPGVIASIFEFISDAKKPITEADILKKLVKRFPDKTESSMANTIKVQIGTSKRPVRMEREKGVTFKITESKNGKAFSI